MSIKKYSSMIRAGILDALQFRLALIVTTVGNLLYLLLIYHLWKAVFASADSPVVNGMTFSDTMIYLVFASSLMNFMEMWVVWFMGRSIQSGEIACDLLRPISYRSWRFFDGIGENIVKFVTTFLPTAIVVFIVSKGAIKLGSNLLFFVFSAGLSLVINFYINFMVGTICMYTDTIWGINIMKVVIVELFSGATVPIAFFPDSIKQIVLLLPFQTIVNTPLQLLLHPEFSLMERFTMLAPQITWFVILFFVSDWFFNISLRRITVNGG